MFSFAVFFFRSQKHMAFSVKQGMIHRALKTARKAVLREKRGYENVPLGMQWMAMPFFSCTDSVCQVGSISLVTNGLF